MAKPLQKERENRSADKKDLTFHPYTITPESAHTSILLLESAEPEILCQVNFITKHFCPTAIVVCRIWHLTPQRFPERVITESTHSALKEIKHGIL